MNFETWLKQASEDDKRLASEYRHHYPVEIAIMAEGEYDMGDGEDFRVLAVYDTWRHMVVCGCAPEWRFPVGHEHENNPRSDRPETNW